MVVILNFKKRIQEELSLSEEEVGALPSGYQVVGDVAILNLGEELMSRAGAVGDALMSIHPRIETVCVKKGGVKGVKRLPQIVKVAGGGTETVHKESGVLYELDVTKVMFSKGNLSERSRLVDEIKDGEVVVDLFAGIGYFTLPIAKFTPVKKVWAVEINPESFHYLKRNIRLNKVDLKVKAVLGDCREVGLPEADRVLMGFFPGTEAFLDRAVSVCKKNGKIHYHNVAGSEEEFLKPVRSKGLSVDNVRKVKSFAPRVWHWVADLTND